MNTLFLLVLFSVNDSARTNPDLPFESRYDLIQRLISEKLNGANKVTMYGCFGNTKGKPASANGKNVLIVWYYDSNGRDTLYLYDGKLERHTIYDTVLQKKIVCNYNLGKRPRCDTGSISDTIKEHYFSNQEFACKYDSKGRITLIYETAQSIEKRKAQAGKKQWFDKILGPPPRIDSVCFT